MSDLRKPLENIIWKYLHDSEEVEGLSGDLMEILEPTIFDERRAAAQSIRDQCTAIAYEIQEGAITQIVANTADHIRRQILKVPLDTPDDGRG